MGCRSYPAPEHKERIMDFDDVLTEIGELGKYQIRNYILICLPVFFSAANSITYVFTSGKTNHRCFVPGCDDEFSVYDSPWTEGVLPPQDKGPKFKPAECLMYERRNASGCNPDDFSDVKFKCDKWVFDDERTIVTEWEITCFENQWMLSLIGTLHFAGIVVGSGAFGVLADYYGRKNVFIFCTLFMAATGVLQGLSTNYIMFAVFAFLNAIGTSGVFPLAFIIGLEMVGRKKRETSAIVLNYFYAVGEAAVALVAWIWPNWVIIQLCISGPAFIFVVYYWLIPESVRWLMAKHKNKKAYRIIRKAAKINNVVLSENLLSNFEMPDKIPKNNEMIMNDDNSNDDDEETPEKVRSLTLWLEMFKSKVMMTRLVLMFYIWAANAFVFYGLSLNSANMEGNKYLVFALVCLVEIPGYTAAWIFMNRIGRRWSLAGSLFLCTISCVGAAFALKEYEWISIVLFLIGKLGITSSFGIVYVHTAEMLPTGIRSGGVGSASTFARVGAMIAPFVPLLENYIKSLPLLIYGFAAFVGTICALFLPETLGFKLPDTVKEAKKIGRQNEEVNL